MPYKREQFLTHFIPLWGIEIDRFDPDFYWSRFSTLLTLYSCFVFFVFTPTDSSSLFSSVFQIFELNFFELLELKENESGIKPSCVRYSNF